MGNHAALCDAISEVPIVVGAIVVMLFIVADVTHTVATDAVACVM